MKQKQNPEVLAAAVAMLRIADPELTPAALMDALEYRQQAFKPAPAKMLTINQFCELVHLSRPTIFRMMRTGKLKTVMVGERSRRIPADVAETFLSGAVV
jgi:excisionase family DNA binding protein